MGRPSVLIVDDEAVIRENLRELFGREYDIHTAGDAGEAMDLLDREKVHVVVSDYKMPGTDGLTFLVRVKDRHPRVIRALMTAYADMNLVIRALNEGGIHRFISKPFKSLDFRRILEECLRLSAAWSAEEPVQGAPRTVIVAHDSQIQRSLLRLALTPTYRVLATSNGLEVLSLVTAEKVDALVLGVVLDFMDGCTITSYLKKERLVTFPIAIWSAGIEAAFKEYLKEIGADAWFDLTGSEAAGQLQEFLRTRIV